MANFLRFLCAISFLVLSGPSFAAAPSKALIDDKVVALVKRWLNVPVMYIAVGAQNDRYAHLGSGDIDALDAQWRRERDARIQPLIASTLNNPLSTYLTQVQAASGGLFTEIFVMDAKGLNVGQSSITTDFWQGDEAKYQKTFLVGSDAIFIDEPEEEAETSTWRSQLNLTQLARRAARQK